MIHSLDKNKLSKNVVFLASLLALCLTVVAPHQAHAITANSALLNTYTNCNTGNDTAFTGLLSVPQDSYNVYVHLQKRGQIGTVQAYAQVNDNTGNCTPIGPPTVVNGDSWTYIGVYGEPQTDQQTIFQIASADLGATLDANRPSLMLVSQTNPVCVPTTECFVTVDGAQGYVTPPGTLPTLDSLHVVRAIDPATDTINKVTYYVDDDAVYSTKTLEAFDLRYVTFSNQSLTRVIQYGSGQQVVVQQSPPDSYTDTFWNFLFRIFQSNPNALPTMLWIAGISLVGGLALGISHAVQRHRLWEMDHGFIHERYALITDADRRAAFLRDHVTTIIRRVILGVLLIAAIITVIIVLNKFVGTLFRVDGYSMESTFKNGTEVYVNEIPITLAHLSGVDYTPKRGDVVILHAIYGVTDQVTADSQKEYIIKRVIGLPGERVLVKNSTITIFNTTHPDGFNPDAGSLWAKTYHANDPNEDIDVTLGANELFVSGDNRPVSVDSRFNGPIRTSEVVGEAAFKLWPIQ